MPRRVDANQAAIVSALRNVGASVQILSEVGKGCPDLLVGWRGINLLFECKDGSKPPSKIKLTPDELEWHSTWMGQVTVVVSPSEAVAMLRDW